jgi:hypothetical protein
MPDRVLGQHALHLCAAAQRQVVSTYNLERNHQGLGNRLLAAQQDNAAVGSVQCRERLGGLLNFHHREAA